MTIEHLARTLDAVANRLQVIIGLTTELRVASAANAQEVNALDAAVHQVVQLLREIQPKGAKEV